MPQGRRKVAFSGKKKKKQILVKRQSKGSKFMTRANEDDTDEGGETTSTSDAMQKINLRPSDRSQGNRYALQFHKESKKELLYMKQEARKPLKFLEPKEREIADNYFINYDFPTRPKWNFGMSKEELNRNENRYFTEYIQTVEKLHNKENNVLGLFELNLETWRQLWRVLEISDILLIIVDVRYSSLMFPPSLYSYVTETLKKDIILVLSKVDLVKPELVIAWKDYFLETYPGISVVLFASYSTNKINNFKVAKKCLSAKKGAECALNIFTHVKRIIGSELDLSKWKEKILEDMAEETANSDSESLRHDVLPQKELNELDFVEHVKYRNGILTIGCVGFPNVGKSSIINALKGRKVVSVSRTPGHTKYFQTIFLTNNVKLCDCPGLVFPSSTSKSLQVLLGSYPVAQLREPYGAIRYIAERINLAKLLSVELPADFKEWSAIAICEAWAIRKGFLTAKAARPDIYRAANNILRLTIEGKIILEFFPPKYFDNESKWINHEDLSEVVKLQTADKCLPPEEARKNSSSTETESSNDESDNTESSEDEDNPIPRAPKSQNTFHQLMEE